MRVNNLSKELEVLLGNILSLSNTYCLPTIIDKCVIGKEELNKPLRIALTGITSAGKSTLLNALVKRNIAPTGAAALTYNVNVFHHVSLSPTNEEIIIAHLSNGETLQLSIDSLVNLVDGRLKDGNDLRNKIIWIDAYIESDVLKDIELIDTPGLGSTKGKDSQNTINLFNDKLRQPDVIIYMVQKAPTSNDIEAVKTFQNNVSEGSNAKISGLNTVLAFTHCDNLRQDDAFDELDYSVDFHKKGMKLIEMNQKKHSDFRGCFSKSFTIAALYAQSAHSMTSSDYLILKDLKKQFGARIYDGEISKKKIIEDDGLFYFIGRVRNERSIFIERLDMEIIKYGVWWIGKNPDSQFEDFREHLIKLSGVEQMESYILTTFKRLAVFFKALKILSGIKNEVNTLSNIYQPTLRKEGVHQVAMLCREFEVNVRRSFSFLSVLMDYYQGKSYFKTNEWETALRTIDSCLSGDSNIECLQFFKSYWEDRISYYRLISDNEAIESCLQLIEQIKICV
ncbi:MAG: dynamin family protein [Muribaculaceae bacterium]|nr:dynamin family protein [Muribaculaceae bacterium]